MDRAITTLFMLTSVDGKISTGSSDELDVDKNFPNITDVKEGLHQYYGSEQMNDLWSFNTGRIQRKMGVNEEDFPAKSPISFVPLDNHHLTEHGIRYFCQLSKEFVLITQNPTHPAFSAKEDNLHIIVQDTLDLADTLEILKEDHGCSRLTVQSEGISNEPSLREKLLGYIDIVVAPISIGGKNTATLIDGASIISVDDLRTLGVLKLEACDVLKNSYIRLRYKVVN